MIRNKKKIIRACTVPKSLSFVEGIVDTLKRQGFDVVLLSSLGPEWEKFRQNHDNKCIEVPMERHISLVKDIKSLVNMISVFRKEKPYMVHSMTPKAGMLCMLAGWLTGVPVRIHTFTGLVWPTSTGLKRKILMATDWLTCACATHIIPEGQGVRNDLINGGITKKPLKVLGFGNVKGVDMELFDRNRFADIKKDDDKFTFMFVGRIVGDKGVNELVEAFTQLHEKYENTKLVLVGPYENHLDPVSELTQNRIEANSAIVAVGPKFGDDLLVEYVKADCHVLPSYREGFPNTPMEAGALGLPNIVTDINGAREIVVNEKNGLIVPSKDAKALYDAMERMLSDDVLREKVSKNARPMIASRFEKSFVQQCLIDYYNEILK